MKFPKNPVPSPNVNPGIKNDRGRIIFILIVASIGSWIFSSWGNWENTWKEVWNEIVTEVGSELESEFGIDLSEDKTAEDSSVDTILNDDYEPTPTYEYTPDPEPIPITELSTPLDFTTTSNTTIESDFADDTARQIIQDSRQEIIQQLTENGQEDQIPMVLQMLDEMEKNY